jgi:transketolase
MGMAPVAYTLWQEFLNFDPLDPLWPNRDRFVLSAGHASMLLYSLLHLAGVRSVDAKGAVQDLPAVSLDEIKRFRQLDSRTPGHPEYGCTTGVEMTTGPLGQGLAASVGMAMACRWLGAHFNRPGFTLFDHNVYALAGDGCMMEGLSGEAASLAGHLKLSNLCWLYDSNRITIEGATSLAFSEDVAARFRSYGWNVLSVADANDLEALRQALRAFAATDDRPTLVVFASHIGYGAPHKQASAHGEPLGEEEIRQTKLNYGWPPDAKFLVAQEVLAHFAAGIGRRGNERRAAWSALLEKYGASFPELAAALRLMEQRQLPDGWNQGLPLFPADEKGMATRVSSGLVLNELAKNIPWLIGGSADLSPSTKTGLTLPGAGDFAPGSYSGRNIHFGVREHAMAAVLNGLSLSRIRPFGSSFLVFSDYCRPAIRLSAVMELPVIYVFTHDSIGVGEDGPTHQPVEHLASLRVIPGLLVLRPADANETVEAWRVIMELRRQPAALILSRQNLPVIDRTKYGAASGLARGAYVLADAANGKPQVLLLASGSEVALCLAAQRLLQAENIAARVVSMPSWELFEKQPREYRESVLPPGVTARVSVEQASTLGWARYVGPLGRSMGMDTFGASAPLAALQEKFGFTPARVVQEVKDILTRET